MYISINSIDLCFFAVRIQFYSMLLSLDWIQPATSTGTKPDLTPSLVPVPPGQLRAGVVPGPPKESLQQFQWNLGAPPTSFRNVQGGSNLGFLYRSPSALQSGPSAQVQLGKLLLKYG